MWAWINQFREKQIEKKLEQRRREIGIEITKGEELPGYWMLADGLEIYRRHRSIDGGIIERIISLGTRKESLDIRLNNLGHFNILFGNALCIGPDGKLWIRPVNEQTTEALIENLQSMHFRHNSLLNMMELDNTSFVNEKDRICWQEIIALNYPES